MLFCHVKDALLQPYSCPFAMQNGMFFNLLNINVLWD